MVEWKLNTRYEYIHFVKIEQKPKTAVWSCRNNRSDAELGRVKWYGPWRQYCFFPAGPAVYSQGCLENIAGFIQQLEIDRKHPAAEVIE